MPYSIVHAESPVGWGGQEILVLRESKAFLERGHQVTVLAPPNSEISHRAADFGVPIVQVLIIYRNLQALSASKKATKSLRVDIVNIHGSTDSWLMTVVSLYIRRAPKVVRVRHICAQPSRSLITRWVYRRAAQKVVTIGEAILSPILHLGLPADHVGSTPTGIDPEIYAPGLRYEAKILFGLTGLTVIGVVATIRSWKGHGILIEALKHLPSKHYRFVFVGDVPIRMAIEEESRLAGLADLILFAGYQNNVLLWLLAMDVFVLPSYANEGISQVLVQAMMAEIPVFATTAGAVTEVARVHQSALVIEPSNPHALRAAITSLSDNPALGSHLATGARELVLRSHNEAVMVEKMDSVFLGPLLTAGEG